MKAKDYFEKYDESVYYGALNGEFEAAEKLFFDFTREVKEIADQRNAQTNRAAVAIVKELNEKWNALAAMFKKKYGVEVLKRNAVLNNYKEQIPEIAQFLHKK